jgi:hypothetical protein
MNTPTEGQLIEVNYAGTWRLRHCLYYNAQYNQVVVIIDDLQGLYAFTKWRFPEKVKVKQSDILAHYCKSLDLDPNNIEIV